MKKEGADAGFGGNPVNAAPIRPPVRPQKVPLTGVNITPLNAPAPRPAAGRPEDVNMVDYSGNPGLSRHNEYREAHQSYMIFVTEPTDKQSLHRRSLEVNAVMPAVPKYMHWSEQEISWSRNDHPRVMPSPGAYALTVDPTFIGPTVNVRFSRVLIDNGSSINIMYRDTMVKMGISANMLQPSRTTFHGIVPGVSCAPMGKIWVDVLFGTRENCRTESIQFEVVDLESPYHALLGRLALAKFMASTHTAYLKMKMPGPYGVITISGDYKRAMECASAGSNLAESLIIAAEKKRMYEVVAMAQATQLGMPGLSNPEQSAVFQPPKGTKKIPVDAEHPERTVIIGAGLSEK